MKILRFNDNRVGVLKNGDMVVDISSLISHWEMRGPQVVMDELIGNFDSYRPEIEKRLSRETGEPPAWRASYSASNNSASTSGLSRNSGACCK